MTQLDFLERDFPLNIVDNQPHVFREDFGAWLECNLHVFSEFVKQAKYVKNTMRRERYSCRTIGEFIRHNSAIRERGNGWKINNNRIPDLARLVMLAYPDLSGMFETRCR